MNAVLEVSLWCVTCRGDRVFSALDCGEGHASDCPERCCVDCGAAVLVGLVVEAAPEPCAAVA